MRHLKMTVKVFIPMLAAAVVFSSCSKQEAQPESSKPAQTNTTAGAVPAEPSRPGVSTTNAQPPAPPPSRAAAKPETGTAQSAAQLEQSYASNPDFPKRVEIIYKLSDLATPQSVAVLGRLFQAEKDPDLRTEVLDSLYDIEGLDDKKAVVLAAGASADQPQEVRESAIDGLTDIDPKTALPILQGLLNDPNPEIREAAKDALDQVQEAMKNP